MNHELQWRNQMRKLGSPEDPTSDLWPAIAARIAEAPAARRRFPRIGFAIAATAVIACTGGLLARHLLQRAESENAPEPRTALEWSQPNSPVLAAAAQDLDGASAQLQQALEQRPDAVFLVGLLNRTNSQRMRLIEAQPYAG